MHLYFHIKLSYSLNFSSFSTIFLYIYTLLLVCTLRGNSVCAQDSYNFTSYTQEEGLASSTITGITKDSTGFLWLFSENGLTRFDGYEFKVYRSNASDSSGISSPYILDMYADSSGNFMLLTANSLSRYNEKAGNFLKIISFPRPGFFLSAIPGISRKWVAIQGNLAYINTTQNSFTLFPFPKDFYATGLVNTFESHGHIYISDQHSIFRFNTTTKIFHRINIVYNDLITSSVQKTVISIFRNAAGQDCFYSLDGLFAYNNKNNYFERICKSQIDPHTQDGEITGKCLTADKILCIALRKGETHFINTLTGADRTIHLSVYCKSDLRDNFSVLGAHYSSGNTIWFNTLNSGIFGYNFTSNSVTHLINDKSNQHSLPSNACNNIFAEGDGVLWVSIPGIGLVKGEEFKPVIRSFAPFSNSKITVSALSKNVRNIIEYNSTHLLITSLDGCFLFNKQNGNFNYLEDPLTLKPIVDKRAFGAAVFDSDSNLYIGSWYNMGLYCMSNKKKKLILYNPAQDQRSKSFVSIRCLYFDEYKNLWIGTADNVIYRIHNPEKIFSTSTPGRIDVFMGSGSSNDSLRYNIVFSITGNKKGDIFFGTQNGLYIYRYSNGNIQKYKNTKSNIYKTAGDDIRAVCFDNNSTLWIGTNGGGLSRITNSGIINYRKENGLPDNIIYSIVEDNLGFLWLGTNRGLCRFDKENGICRNYAPKDGIQNFEFNTNAVCRTGLGMIAIGGVSGFSFFNPSLVKPAPSPPRVTITQLKIGNTEYTPGSSEVYLNHNQNYLSFQFASLNYFRNSENKFAYRLEGLDKDWIYCDNRRFTNYANLPSGDYVFYVKASNYYGEWSSEAAMLRIHIATAWYNTWQFRLALFIFVSVIVYIVFRIRLQQKLKLADVRNKIARDLHDEIGSNLSSISLFSAVAKEKAALAPDPVTPLLNKILDYTQTSQEAMNDIVWMINSRNDSFEKIIVRMRALAAELFETKNISFHLSADERLNAIRLGMNERKNFYLIYKEAINNIVKYSGCTNVYIDISRYHGRLVLKIRDDGKGFDTLRKYTGNGLVNMKNRANELHGELLIQSHQGKGASIELQFEL